MRSMLLMVMVLLVAACGSGTGASTTTEKVIPATAPPAPTVNVQATIEAGVKATVVAQPTATLPAKSTAAPAAPTSAPTAVPKAATAPKVEVIDSGHYTNIIGATVIFGLVQNNGDGEAGSIQVAASLIDGAGATVGAGSDYVNPRILKPGDKGVFEMSVSKGPDFKDIKLQVQARPVDSLLRQMSTSEFKLDGVSVGPPSSISKWNKVSGQITNTGAKPANLVLIAIAIYGPDGKVYMVGTTTAKLGEIGPGQSSPFEFTFLTNREPVPIAKYDLFVSGTPGQ